MGSSKKIVSGVFWSAIVNIVTAVYGFIAAPLLIGYFGKADYGLIALANSVNGYMHLMDMGLTSTNIRFFSKWLAKGDNNKVRKLLQTCTAFYFVVGLINALALIVICVFSEQIFNVTPEQNDDLQKILVVLACMAVVNWYTSCFNQLITATENVAWVQKRQLLTKILMVVVLFSTLFFKLSLVHFFIATQLVVLIILPLTIKKVIKEAPFISFLAKFDWPTFKEILPYSLNIFSFGVFQFSFYNLRTVFLGIRSTPDIITEFNVMNSIVAITTTVSSVFLSATLPSSARIVEEGDKQNYYRIAYQGTKFVTVFLCLTALGMMVISSDLIKVYVGDSFMHLVPWLMTWLIFVVFGSHNQCISSLILAGSDVRAITRNTIFSSIIGLLVTWFSIPYLGAGGPVVAYLVYGSCQILFYWFYYWPQKMQISSVKVVFSSFLPFLFLGLSVSFVLKMTPHLDNHWLNILLFGGGYVVLFSIGAWLLLKDDDRKFVLGILKRKSM